MKIGFDLDGVLIEDSDSILWAMMNKDLQLIELFIKCLKPSIHPSMFLHDNDIAFIITARQPELKILTVRWCIKHYPSIHVAFAATPPWTDYSDWKRWFKEVARQKAKIINNLNLDVYFEDMTNTVDELRELCPNTKIIQYGGRLK